MSIIQPHQKTIARLRRDLSPHDASWSRLSRVRLAFTRQASTTCVSTGAGAYPSGVTLTPSP